MSTDPFGGQEQQAFLEGLRARRRAGSPSNTEKESYPPASARGTERESVSYDEKANLFIESLEGVGGVARRVPNIGEAYQVVAEELKRRSVRRVLAGGGDWSQWTGVLKSSEIHLETWDEVSFSFGSAERSLERVNQWDAGMNWADFGVAELGSVALLASPQQGRSVSLLPPIYVALIPGERLVYSRRQVFAHVAEEVRTRQSRPALTFITGPSRSADIEMDLSVGVHGPGEVVAILVDSGGP